MRLEADQTRVEERLAHLQKIVDELSEVIARQDRELQLMTRRVAFLIEREAEREAMARDAPDPDTRPPHW
jgi:SlyX protein